MQLISRAALALIAGLAVAGLPSAAQAAAPSASTQSANQITSGSAQLRGTVNPNGERTTYHFEYGTTRRYGSRTPDVSAGSGTSNRAARATVSGLRPNTRYHFRLVASNPSGVVSGENRSFRTRVQPLGVQITAAPNPVTFLERTGIFGRITGTGAANREVVLQQRVFPYTGAWQTVGTPRRSDAAGNFSFTGLLLPQTSQFRVRASGGAFSGVLTLGVAVRIRTSVSATRVTRGRSVRFSGVIRPARAGAQYAIQKRTRDGRWVVVAGGITRGGSPNFSGFSKRVRVPTGGQYRVYVRIVDGNIQSGIGRTVTIRTR
jgi:hypothetical protein